MLKPGPSARARTLLALLCGAVACVDDNERSSAVPASVATGGSGMAGVPGSAGHPIAGAPSGGGGGGGGQAPRRAGSCEDAIVILVNGAPTGMVKCLDGSLARVGPTQCRLPDLSDRPACPPLGTAAAGSRCAHDPCFDGPHGRLHASVGPYPSGIACDYFCESDADCPGQTRCACDEQGYGLCRFGGCTSAESCGSDETCRLASNARACDPDDLSLACVSADATCVVNAHCAATQQQCIDRGQGRRCAQGQGACGRPIFVDETPRLASLVRGLRWEVAV